MVKARPTIEPVTAANLDAFGAFLHRHLNARLDGPAFVKALTPSWPGSSQAGNHGFLLRDAGEIVGGIGALYAERSLRGRVVRSCNITSWCVLEAYRQHSTRLAMSILAQPGYLFTDFTPTAVVGQTLRFIRFEPLDERQYLLPNLPRPAAGSVLATEPQIESRLDDAELLAHWREHRGFPWLNHVFVGAPGSWCHVIYKRARERQLPCARVLHVSHPERLSALWPRLATHLLRRGLLATQIESRLLPQPPALRHDRSGFNAKVFRSDDVAAAEVDCLYSELMVLDL